MELNSLNSWADELDRKSVVYLVCFKYNFVVLLTYRIAVSIICKCFKIRFKYLFIKFILFTELELFFPPLKLMSVMTAN